MIRRLSIASRMLLCVVLGVLLVGGTAAYFVDRNYEALRAQRLGELQRQVDLAMSIVAYHRARALEEGRSPDEANQAAFEQLETLRFGQNDYFHVYEGTVVRYHGGLPKLKGRDLVDAQDPNGLYLVRRTAEEIAAYGESSFDYMWPRAGTNLPIPKLGYNRRVPDSPYWLGTGVYIDDLEADFWQNFEHAVLYSILAMAMLTAISVAIGRSVTQPLNAVRKRMIGLAGNDDESPVPEYDAVDEVGEMARSLKVFQDNKQELARNRQRLSEALEKERELNRLQRQFVSMVCHEFRTPLSIIDGAAQRIVRRHDNIKADRLLDGLGKIRTSVVRLVDLIESVLDTARLEGGNIKFEPHSCDLGGLIQEVCADYQELNDNRDFIVDVQRLPEDFSADVDQIRKVMSNLISNAIKYSPDGSRIWVDGVSDGDDGVTISVRDEGAGISADEKEKIFERFFRGQSSVGIVGTGIGLQMVEAMVDMHGGSVKVASNEGEGTTFNVHLPVQNYSSPMTENSIAA